MFRTLLAAVGTAALVAVPVATPASASVDEPFAAPTGVLFGVAGDATVEASSDRTFSMHRVYETMGRNLIDGKVKDDAAKGRRTVLSVKANVPWAQIAAGRYDGELVREAQQIKAFGKPILIGFHHEPEDDLARFGTPADFAAAFRRFVTVYREQGVTNAEYAWIMMTWNFRKGGPAVQYYPGDDYVDYVATDGYNSAGCRSGAPNPAKSKSFAGIFQGAYDFAVTHNKMFVAAEYGSVEFPSVPGLKAQWILDSAVTAKTWPSLKGMAYFNHGVDAVSVCKWSLDSSTTALQAFLDNAKDPFFNNVPKPTGTGGAAG